MIVRRSFNLNRSSVGASRRFIGETLADLPQEMQEAITLMVSELATNAIVHALTGFEVCVERDDSNVRVEVADVGGGRPELQAPSANDTHGRGLQIVKSLSDQWGIIEMAEMGKTVWFMVALDPAGGPDSDRASRGNKRSRPTRRPAQAPGREAKGQQDHRSDGDRPKASIRKPHGQRNSARGGYCRRRSLIS
jgi:anti-sigma regulatory factor (Ser/Thr protein kinase)